MKLVTREAWAAEAPRAVKVPVLQPQYLVVHYTGFNGDEQAKHDACAARVRGIQHYHQDVKGWADIAYNHLVCKHGYVFEGRGFGVMTAATFGFNAVTQAVCFLGDDTANRDDVTAAGREALVDISRVYARKFKLKVGYGHRDFVATACPGDELYRYVKSDDYRLSIMQTWPVPLPDWFWIWARWRLGEGEFKGKARGASERPSEAPTRIPPWAFDRLKALLAQRQL